MLTKTDQPTVLKNIDFIPLSRLRSGDTSPVGPLHARKTAPDPEADKQLKASILEEGVIQSVFACSVDESDLLYLGIGNRRLRLLGELRDAKKIPADYAVPAIIVQGMTPADVRAKSLAENIQRADLHPVDRYEAFKQMEVDGSSIDEIARRTGRTRKAVEQSLALGALSDKVREAWRAGMIGEETARVFTIAADHKRQDQVLARITKGLPRGVQPNAWQVRQELKIDSNSYNAHLLKVVGQKAYEAAGGKFTRDLFTNQNSDEQIIADPDVLARVVEEKMQAECARLVEEGWKWAEIDTDHARYSCDHLDKKKYTDEEKTDRGCYVFLGHGPAIEIEHGFIKSRAKTAGEKAQETKTEKAATKPKSANEISQALERRLNAQFEVAVKSALIAHPHKDGLGKVLASLTAKLIIPSAQTYSGHTPHEIVDGMKKIADAIDKKAMSAALLKAFDAADYFGAVNVRLREKALAEMGWKERPGGKGTPTKAAEWTKLCITKQAETGWLPRELRTAHYAGAGAKKR